MPHKYCRKILFFKENFYNTSKWLHGHVESNFDKLDELFHQLANFSSLESKKIFRTSFFPQDVPMDTKHAVSTTTLEIFWREARKSFVRCPKKMIKNTLKIYFLESSSMDTWNAVSTTTPQIFSGKPEKFVRDQKTIKIVF